MKSFILLFLAVNSAPGKILAVLARWLYEFRNIRIFIGFKISTVKIDRKI